MIDLEQEVMIKWFTRNKKKFTELGYKFTNFSDMFAVKVKDLDENASVKVVVQCDVCGETIVTPYRNYNKIVHDHGAYRCRKCNAPYVSEIRINNNAESALNDFNKMILDIGYEPIASIEDYTGCDDPMPFICPIHGKQGLSINQLRQGCVCPKCGKENRRQFHMLSTQEVIDIVSSKNNNVVLNPEDYINTDTKNLKIKCGSCGEIFLSSLSSLKNGQGHCRKCALKAQSKTSRLQYERIIADTTIDGVCYLLNPQDYENSNKRNLLFKCTSCGEVFTQSLSHYKQGDTRCIKCISKISVGENRIMNVLDKYNVTYLSQKRYSDCKDKKPLPFDFYLPDYNCCIEFDGYQHHNMVAHDTSESFAKRQEHDKIKTEYCEHNGIHLIRIPYWEYKNIESILCNELNIMQLEDIV